jgi:hypothetical protein
VDKDKEGHNVLKQPKSGRDEPHRANHRVYGKGPRKRLREQNES